MASEIRVDKINSLSGVGTVTLSPTGVDISGITTAATLKATTGIVTTLTATTGIVTTLTTNTTRATTGIVTTLTATTGIVTTLTTNTLTANSTAKVGSGVTLSPDGDVFVTGVTTSSTVNVGAAVTISESGIEASGIGITVANINGQQISGRKNLIVNGEMKVCQRAGTTSTAVTNENARVLDSWLVGTASGGGTSLNVQQQLGNPTGAPYGYAASMKMTVAVADDGGSDSFNVVQARMENLDTNYLAFGTSQAKTVTLQFYVKSSLTGTFGGSLVSGDFSKGYVFQYTINSADTWEKKVITIPGDTASTADSVYNRGSATSARGLVLYFDLGSGSNSEKSAANDWTATATWGYAARISGNVKLCANAGADWSMTGCQLEVGSQSTEFEHRSFGEELSLCQRYYFKFLEGNNKEIAPGWYYTGSHVSFILRYPTTMRTTPTGSVTDVSNSITIYRNGAADQFDGFAFEYGSTEQYSAYNSSQVSGTAGQAGIVRSTSSAAKVEFSAEL